MLARCCAVAMLLAALGVGAEAAGDYPSRPIRVIAPFPPGGTLDLLIRGPADQVGAQLGQALVIDNRGGANGIIGTDIAAKAPPDGYTLLAVTGSFVINPSVYRKLPYDVIRDFAPITNLARATGYLMVIHPSVPARSVRELIALAQQPGSRLVYGSPGVGNPIQLACEMFNQRAGTQLMHVPYKGAGPLVNALLAGEVHMTIMPPIALLEHIKGGTMRALAFTGPARWSELSEVPTMAEAGVPDLVYEGTWVGLFAPAATPRAIVERLHREVAKALATPRIAEIFRQAGYVPDGGLPEAFGSFVKAEVARYAEIVRAAGIQPE
ncbi:MAG: tripartite tricarboxylate transporter substrate binding protein [Proteobacteria bacterium]|nr:tripartite tricarboxylate transporter substrate binding protein [Pseudomonadota bacterium]